MFGIIGALTVLLLSVLYEQPLRAARVTWSSHVGLSVQIFAWSMCCAVFCSVACAQECS
jgi:hypothetical protein